MKTFSKSPALGEQSKIIDCPVCSGKRFKSRWHMDASFFVECRTCRLLLQNPQPLRGELAARYDEEYFHYEIENEESFFNLMMLGLADINFFESIQPTLPEPKRILDIGCATGRLLKHFKDLGWETRGAELCCDSAEYGNTNYDVNISASSMESSAFEDSQFSMVHASHLIEHVDNPATFAAEVYRTLMPQGVFVCVTPSSDGFQAKLFGGEWRSLIADHVFLFNKKNLSHLLTNAGFEVEQVKTWGGIATGIVPSWLKKPIDRMAKKYGFGDVVLMLARKP